MNRQLTLHEALILDALSNCDAPVDLDTLHELADPRGKEQLSFELLTEVMSTLLFNELIDNVHPQGFSKWQITAKGQAKLIGQAVSEIGAERIPTAPIRATMCNRIEPREPSTALLCVDEDELDTWWKSLDVEQKADAFTRFSLTAYCDSHIAVEESLRVPVAGTIGEAGRA